MSIIFQLFSAEDLQKLTKDELKKLRDEILAALEQDLAFDKNIGKIHLNLKQKVAPDAETPPGLKNPQPEWVQEALLKRFHEVSHQLKTPPRDPSQPGFNFEALINKRNDIETQEQEKLILDWAISCELNHIEFYYTLLVAKKGVDNFYAKYLQAKAKLLTAEQQQVVAKLGTPEQRQAAITLEKVRTKDPDSLYSPFNPRHPLYRQYYDASRSGPEMTAQTPPSGS
jgi:hypothetical protein